MNAVPSVSPADARVCIVAITRHGAAQAAALARRLPQASICTSARFAGAFADVANPGLSAADRAEQGKRLKSLTDEVEALESRWLELTEEIEQLSA